jgi:hypothetical protein
LYKLSKNQFTLSPYHAPRKPTEDAKAHAADERRACRTPFLPFVDVQRSHQLWCSASCPWIVLADQLRRQSRTLRSQARLQALAIVVTFLDQERYIDEERPTSNTLRLDDRDDGGWVVMY